MAKSERQFSAEIRSDLKTYGGNSIFVQLLPDMRMTGKKPFDFFFIYKHPAVKESKFIAVECKKEDGLSFNTEKILNHQWMKLGEVVSLGQEAYFVIAFTRFKEVFIVSPGLLTKMIENHGRTISYEQFISTTLKMKRIKYGDCTIWDVEKLLDYRRHLSSENDASV